MIHNLSPSFLTSDTQSQPLKTIFFKKKQKSSNLTRSTESTEEQTQSSETNLLTASSPTSGRLDVSRSTTSFAASRLGLLRFEVLPQLFGLALPRAPGPARRSKTGYGGKTQIDLHFRSPGMAPQSGTPVERWNTAPVFASPGEGSEVLAA